MDEQLFLQIKEEISKAFYSWTKGSVPENQLNSLTNSIIKIVYENFKNK